MPSVLGAVTSQLFPPSSLLLRLSRRYLLKVSQDVFGADYGLFRDHLFEIGRGVLRADDGVC